MKRIILILLVVAVGAYFTYSHFEGKAKEKAERKAEQERVQKLRESVRAAVSKMVSNFGAIDDWERKLREGSTGASSGRRILTMELESLWMTDKPILFKGHIKDIATLDHNTYSMWLDKQYDLSKPSFKPKFALFLKCPKTMIDSFLGAYPAAKEIFANVAVIAKIEKIESRSEYTKEDEEVETKIGFGQCLDLLYRDRRALEHGEL